MAASMQQLCLMCGNTFGSHCADRRGDLCPAHEGRMDFMISHDGEHGPTFEGSEVYEDPEQTKEQNKLAWVSGRKLKQGMTEEQIGFRLEAARESGYNETCNKVVEVVDAVMAGRDTK